jgi:hypothetical protein
VLVGVKDGRPLTAGDLDGNDLALEPAGRLGRGEALLRAQCPTVLRVAADLKFADQILGVPARRLIRERVIEAVTQHAVVELAVAHAVAPAAARNQVRRQIHILHASGHGGLGSTQEDLMRR